MSAFIDWLVFTAIGSIIVSFIWYWIDEYRFRKPIKDGPHNWQHPCSDYREKHYLSEEHNKNISRVMQPTLQVAESSVSIGGHLPKLRYSDHKRKRSL